MLHRGHKTCYDINTGTSWLFMCFNLRDITLSYQIGFKLSGCGHFITRRRTVESNIVLSSLSPCAARLAGGGLA